MFKCMCALFTSRAYTLPIKKWPETCLVDPCLVYACLADACPVSFCLVDPCLVSACRVDVCLLDICPIDVIRPEPANKVYWVSATLGETTSATFTFAGNSTI